MSETTTPDPVPGWMQQLERYGIAIEHDLAVPFPEPDGTFIYASEVEALLRQIAADYANVSANLSRMQAALTACEEDNSRLFKRRIAAELRADRAEGKLSEVSL